MAEKPTSNKSIQPGQVNKSGKAQPAITRDGLEKQFPGEGDARYDAIADAGGFGRQDSRPDLDITGLYDENPNRGKEVIDQIQERRKKVEDVLNSK